MLGGASILFSAMTVNLYILRHSVCDIYVQG